MRRYIPLVVSIVGIWAVLLIVGKVVVPLMPGPVRSFTQDAGQLLASVATLTVGLISGLQLLPSQGAPAAVAVSTAHAGATPSAQVPAGWQTPAYPGGPAPYAAPPAHDPSLAGATPGMGPPGVQPAGPAYAPPGYGAYGAPSVPLGAGGLAAPVGPIPVGQDGYRGVALAGLILGIISLPSAVIAIVGIVVGIVGIVLSARGRRSTTRHLVASVGLLFSIIGLALGLMNMVSGIVLSMLAH